MDNSKIIIGFKYLKTLREIQGNEPSKNALQTVIDSIESANFIITSGDMARMNLKGVGVKSVAYINSILKNNDPSKCGIYELDNLDYNMKHKLITIYEMLKLSGVGIVTAKAAYENGITDINVFKEHLLKDGTHRQQIGIKYEEDFNNRIPRAKVTNFINKFGDKLGVFNITYNTFINFEIGGSYKRAKQTSGDIDIILWSLVPNQVSSMFMILLNFLQNEGILKETISLGNIMYQGVASIDENFPSVRIDIKPLHSMKDYYYAVLYFTGPGKFNEMMREKAKSMGLTLGNDDMIVNSSGEKIYVRDEKDIFTILGIEWKEPYER
jgi:DNA polymerase (family 10)